MKKLLTLILLACFLTAHAQEHKTLKVLGTMAAWTAFNAIGDGLNDNGEKGWGHTMNALSYATLIAGTAWSRPEKGDALNYVVIAGGVRYVGFNAIYNKTRNLPLDYIGTTAFTDKAQSKVPAGFRTFTKGIVLCGTIGFTIDRVGYRPVRHINKNRTVW